MNSVDLLSNVTHLIYVMTYNSTENGNILTKLESQPVKWTIHNANPTLSGYFCNLGSKTDKDTKIITVIFLTNKSCLSIYCIKVHKCQPQCPMVQSIYVIFNCIYLKNHITYATSSDIEETWFVNLDIFFQHNDNTSWRVKAFNLKWTLLHCNTVIGNYDYGRPFVVLINWEKNLSDWVIRRTRGMLGVIDCHF